MLLGSPSSELSPEALRELYEERAGIIEYLGNLPREAAEAAAELDIQKLHPEFKKP